MTAGVITVAIVEDDRPTRDALDALIGGTPHFRSIATFGSVEEALAGLANLQPDLLLLDIHLQGIAWSQGVCDCFASTIPGIARSAHSLTRFTR